MKRIQNVGYRRVSSREQSFDRQLTWVELDRVFEEKASARTADRPQLKACLGYVRAGDTLHVHSIDRLARNLTDLTDIVDSLTASGVTVRFHNEGITFDGREDSPMNRLLLQMLGAAAEFQQNLIKERRREGQEAAWAAGKRRGASPIPAKKQKRALELVAGGMPKEQVAKEVGISRQSVYKLLKSQDQTCM